MKPTISREEDQFLSELVEKCCEFEANERIDFKSICNLIETQFSKLYLTQQHKRNNANNQEKEYQTTPARDLKIMTSEEEYQTTPAPALTVVTSEAEYQTTPAQNQI